MESLIAEALKGANSPLVVIVLVLIAKDFYQGRTLTHDAANNATLAATLKSIAESLNGLCSRVDLLLSRSRGGHDADR